MDSSENDPSGVVWAVPPDALRSVTVDSEASDVSLGGRLPADAFEAFFVDAERRLTVALVARYGAEVGRDAAVDAFAWAWENWERVRQMGNPAGYVYRVGQTAARRKKWLPGLGSVVPDAPFGGHGQVDAHLGAALAALSTRQRQVTVLVHAYGFTHREAGDLLGISSSSVQNHAERGIAKLRQHMEANP